MEVLGVMDLDPDPIEVLGAIRDSFQDASFVYKNGSCFALYRILKVIFPHARAWTNIDHVWIEINGKFYDIDGARSAGSDGLMPMDEDTRMFERAHRWAWRSNWRIGKDGKVKQ